MHVTLLRSGVVHEGQLALQNVDSSSNVGARSSPGPHAGRQSVSESEPTKLMWLELAHAVHATAPEDPDVGCSAKDPMGQLLQVSSSTRYWPAPHWRQSSRTDPPPLPVNISPVFVHPVSQQSVWLNAIAYSNITSIVVTLLVSQLPIFWSNEDASRNIYDIVVTLLVSQLPIF